MKCSRVFLAFVLFLSFSAAPLSASAKDSWVSVRSKNFLLVGNASEKNIRQVALRLEQFREVFSNLFTHVKVGSPVPTTVVVFKDDHSFKPFKPSANAAGYFQPGPDVNYIALTTEQRGAQDAFSVIFHEYSHLLVDNTNGNVPTWFNEGLAEYYSTLTLSDDQRAVVGRPIASHVYLLREKKLLPLRTLFEVDQKSPYYNERAKQSVFYAESWALLHYLILGRGGHRTVEVSKFVERLSANVPVEQAFQESFTVSFEEMERQLRDYVKRDRYPVLTAQFQRKLGIDSQMQTAPVTEAEAQAYLGDLLLHSNRIESERYLQKALSLDPKLSMANASLGMLRVRQNKLSEARQSLERAVESGAQNYLIHYYYAYTLSREGNSDMDMVAVFSPGAVPKMREHLKKAIELREDFLESYSLLAFVNLVTGTELDNSIEMLHRALKVSPGRPDLLFMLAQILARKEDYKGARELLQKLTGNVDPEISQKARSVLAQIQGIEDERARAQPARIDISSDPQPANQETTSVAPEKLVEPDPSSFLRDALKRPGAGELRVQGSLMRIDCDASGITFVIRAAQGQLKLRTATFQRVDMTSFSSDAGRQVTCGLRRPENNVIVIYEFQPAPVVKSDGVVKSIEFVPQDFKLEP